MVLRAPLEYFCIAEWQDTSGKLTDDLVCGDGAKDAAVQ